MSLLIIVVASLWEESLNHQNAEEMTKTGCCTFEGQKFKDRDRCINIDWLPKCFLPCYKARRGHGEGKEDKAQEMLLSFVLSNVSSAESCWVLLLVPHCVPLFLKYDLPILSSPAGRPAWNPLTHTAIGATRWVFLEHFDLQAPTCLQT